MLLMLSLMCLAGATFGSVVVYQRAVARLPEGAPPPRALTKGERAAQSRPEEEPTLETLSPGDVVIQGSEDAVIAGTVSYREERDQWALHQLDAGASTKLLEVRPLPGGLETALLELVSDAPIFGTLGSGLTYRGQGLSLASRGDARTTIIGSVDDRSEGVLRYTRYTGGGDALLVIEEEGTERRAYFGFKLPPATFTIYSGELNRSGTITPSASS